MRDTKQITYVRLDPETRSRLRELADQEDRPMSYLIRAAVEQYLNRRKPVASAS